MSYVTVGLIGKGGSAPAAPSATFTVATKAPSRGPIATLFEPFATRTSKASPKAPTPRTTVSITLPTDTGRKTTEVVIPEPPSFPVLPVMGALSALGLFLAFRRKKR